MDTRSLDDIIAKAIPMLPGDCKRSKSKKEWMREEAKKRIIQWAASELMAWSMNNALSKASAMGIDVISPLPIDPDLKAAIDESRNDKDLTKGGTVSGDIIAMVGDDPNRHEICDKPEDILPPDAFKEMINKFIEAEDNYTLNRHLFVHPAYLKKIRVWAEAVGMDHESIQPFSEILTDRLHVDALRAAYPGFYPKFIKPDDTPPTT